MRKILTAIIISIFTFINVVPVSATTNDFYFNDATYDFYLSKNADGTSHLKVREKLTATFPETNQNHGITRVIPYTNQAGKNRTMDKLNIAVTRNGQPENIAKIDEETNAYIIYIGNSSQYVHGEQIYVLEYEFNNVVTDFTDYQELYWDTNGTGWSQKFNSLTANIHFENIPTPEITNNTWCYVGTKGSNNQTRCKINSISDGISFSTTNLNAGENLTYDIQFPANTFNVVSQKSYILVITIIILAFISMALIAYLIHIYSKYAKEDRLYYKGLLTPVQYIPDRNYTVAEIASAYLGTTNNPQVATLLELAVSHKVELVQTDKKKWSIHVKDTTNLTPDQIQTLQIFTGSTSTIQPGQDIPVERHSSYSATRNSLINSFPTTIKNSLIKKGLLHEKTHSTLPTVLTMLYVFGVILGFIGLKSLLENTYATIVGEQVLWPIIIITTIITGLVAIIINYQITKYAKYTRAGLDVSNYAAGLKEYISLAEADRLKFNQSTDGAPKDTTGRVKLYERLLPYAALFGLEKSWLKQLQIYYDENPSLVPAWYIGTGSFDTRNFSSALTSFNSSISSMSSSSSSSGSGGGGFSGGGGGGGGGGGW